MLKFSIIRIIVSCLFITIMFSACSFHEIKKPLTIQEELHRKAEVERLYQRSLKLFAEGSKRSLESADAALLVAIDLLGKEAKLVDARGCIAWARGDKDKARALFHEALEYDSEFSESYEHLAYLAFEDTEYETSVFLYKKALFYNPNNFRARNNNSIELARNGWLMKARDELLKALHSSGEDEPEVIINNINKINALFVRVHDGGK